MSVHEIEKLIKENPSGLRLGNDEAAFGHPEVVVSAVTLVLSLYRQSDRYTWAKRDRQKLKDRLLTAAGRLQELIDYEESHRSKKDKQQAPGHVLLFGEIAAELNLTPQQLQAMTLQRV